MALKGTTAQERAWNFFCAKGLSHYAVSGVMASIRAESGFNPRNLQNSCEKKSGYTGKHIPRGRSTQLGIFDPGFLRLWVRTVDYWSRKQESSQFCQEEK